MVRPRRNSGSLRLLGMLCALLLLSAPRGYAATEYYGQVFFNGMPVPGATVTISRGGQKFTAITDQQGLYTFPNLADGVWKIKIEMSGFSTLNGQVIVGPNMAQGRWELKLLTLPQLLAHVQVTNPSSLPAAPTPPKAAEGTQPSAEPPPPAATNGAKTNEESDGLLINGSVNNAATSPFSLSPAFGNHRPGLRGLYNGSIAAIGENSLFDARPYSLTGLPVPKDIYNRLTTLFTFGGPIKIPHLFYNGPYLFLAYQRNRDRDAQSLSGLVPDVAERDGDLSGLTNPLGQPITIYNPATGLPFTGAIPVSPQAKALLNLYPLPNLAGNSSYNYQTEVLDDTHLDALQTRLDERVGRRDELFGQFAFASSRADTANLFDFRDTTDILGINTEINWSHQFRHDFLMTIGYSFSRLRTQVRPQFENQENVSGEAGIGGNLQDPMDWGPPALVFSSSGIASLTDGNSFFNRNRTDAVSLKIAKNTWHHTVTFGGDYRREEFNQLGQENPRGTFNFTGAATSGGALASGASGSDFADFLLGIPDTSQIAFGNADKYFRGPAYDAFVNDDWRLRPEFTINAGIRWEYGAPLTELYGRLVNLDVAPGFAAVAPVLGTNPFGSLTGQRYPDSLIRPDWRGIEPRLGIAWHPFAASTLVVRAGYGIYDDTSVYLALDQMMAQQAPLSTSVNVANSSTCPLTLADGFLNCAGITPENIGVDPNFRVGYAQEWEASAQRDLPGALVMILTYSGIKGTHGMQEFLPNTYPIGAANPCPNCPTGFAYVTSNGNSTREAGQIELRRRLRADFTATVDYTYAKAIDDDAEVGAQGHVVQQTEESQNTFTITQAAAPTPIIAQNWLDLAAERSLSSFDQRNLVDLQLQYTTGMGLGGGTLLGGWRGGLFKEWTVLTQITAGSGLPEDPVFFATVPGTGYADIARPDLTGQPLYKAPPGYDLNDAAFSAPLPGQWGTAGHNSIVGPSQFSLDTALARTFRVHGDWNLDVRVQATNLLNHVTFTEWNTVVNNTTFGLPGAWNPMRSLQLVGRLRF